MDWLYTLACLLVSYALVQFVRLLLADCDLTLQWATKFGKSKDSLAGTVVWITGASSGIGEAIAYELAEAKCRLVLSSRREGELNRVKKECIAKGGLSASDILVLPVDMLQYNTHQDAVDTVLKYFKKIDVLINNAGRSQRAEWMKTSLDVDRQILELNVLGVLSLTKATLPHMLERKQGHLVIMSSIAGKVGAPFSGSYTGSKHALHGWFEALRIEAAQQNIDITMICPGPVFSNLLSVAFTEEAGKTLDSSQSSNEKRMSTKRCAYLSVVAVANRLDEVWITLNPVLAFAYLLQYMPTWGRSLAKWMGDKQIRKMREGRSSFQGYSEGQGQT